jgi:hypothetical protein
MRQTQSLPCKEQRMIQLTANMPTETKTKSSWSPGKNLRMVTRKTFPRKMSLQLSLRDLNKKDEIKSNAG